MFRTTATAIGADGTPQARIQARVLRFSTGDLGDRKSVGGGVWKARVMFEPEEYRIYLGKDGAQLVLLMLGGDTSTQTADVREVGASPQDPTHGHCTARFFG